MALAALLALTVASLNGCVVFTLLKYSDAPEAGSVVAEGKILIAGRIVLEPEPEQSIKGIVGGE